VLNYSPEVLAVVIVLVVSGAYNGVSPDLYCLHLIQSENENE